MLFTSIYRKKINAAEALIPLVAFNFKTYRSIFYIYFFVHFYPYYDIIVILLTKESVDL
jgi:hypothetical protein